jgi:aconitate hydratase
LKKQGMLALTFSNKDDYNKIQEDDKIDVAGLTEFASEKPLTLVLNHADGTSESISVNHTYNKNQIEWFKAGSALNLMGIIAAENEAKAAPKTVLAKAKSVAKKIVKKILPKALTKKKAKKLVKPAPKKKAPKKSAVAKKTLAKKIVPKKKVGLKTIAKKTSKGKRR